MDPTATSRSALTVLDTNVVLDWLLFDNDQGRVVGWAIVAGTLEWIATPTMREECFEVLGRTALARWRPDVSALRQSWDAHCRLLPAPPDIGQPAIRSADSDDQMFVDLALSEGADLLLSRDRALLDLATPLRAYGVRAMTPAAWVESQASRAR